MLNDYYILWILRLTVLLLKTILEKWLQTGFVFESILSFVDRKITGVWNNHWIPLIHQWRKCHNISNCCERDFLSDFKKTIYVFIRQKKFSKNVANVWLHLQRFNCHPTISKAHACMFSTFFVTGKPIFFKARVAKVTSPCCPRSLVFFEAESWLHYGDGKLSIIRLYFLLLFYCLIICCRTKMTRLMLKAVVTDLYIFGKKGQKIGTNFSTNNYFL